jgi:hypothetical protein
MDLTAFINLDLNSRPQRQEKKSLVFSISILLLRLSRMDVKTRVLEPMHWQQQVQTQHTTNTSPQARKKHAKARASTGILYSEHVR